MSDKRDIVERLKNEATIWLSSETSYDLINDAAEEIASLRAQLAEETAKHVLTLQNSEWKTAKLESMGTVVDSWQGRAEAAEAQLEGVSNLHFEEAKRSNAFEDEARRLQTQLEEEEANAARAWDAWENVKGQLASARKALEAARSPICGYAITKPEQYGQVLSSQLEEIRRMDKIVRAGLAALTDEQGTKS